MVIRKEKGTHCARAKLRRGAPLFQIAGPARAMNGRESFHVRLNELSCIIDAVLPTTDQRDGIRTRAGESTETGDPLAVFWHGLAKGAPSCFLFSAGKPKKRRFTINLKGEL